MLMVGVPKFYIFKDTYFLEGTHEVIEATKDVINFFFNRIIIKTTRKYWNYEKELCIINLSLKTYLVVVYEGILILN